eukprot:COSAG06_NODE_19756_length_823_cov_1.656182_2_plen_73_part_00
MSFDNAMRAHVFGRVCLPTMLWLPHAPPADAIRPAEQDVEGAVVVGLVGRGERLRRCSGVRRAGAAISAKLR